jgi:hypothetical protein
MILCSRIYVTQYKISTFYYTVICKGNECASRTADVKFNRMHFETLCTPEYIFPFLPHYSNILIYPLQNSITAYTQGNPYHSGHLRIVKSLSFLCGHDVHLCFVCFLSNNSYIHTYNTDKCVLLARVFSSQKPPVTWITITSEPFPYQEIFNYTPLSASAHLLLW